MRPIDEQLARSIALELKATFVVLGTTRKSEDDMVQLSARLLDAANVTDKDWSGNATAVNFNAPKSIADLSPLEPLPFFRRLLRLPVGRKYIPSGVDGVSSPRCRYMPNPPYSEKLESLR